VPSLSGTTCCRPFLVRFGFRVTVCVYVDFGPTAISSRRVSMSRRTIRPKSSSGAPSHSAAASLSDRMRSRGPFSSCLFVPITGFSSQSPSPIAQANIADNVERARLAATGPRSFAMLFD